jgi:PST family polysaccharide transporter
MFEKIKRLLTGTEEKKRLVDNIISLSVLQGANYILPLLTVPHLVRVLGPEYFGLIAFATATIMYFLLITDYGFNLSATRQISIYRDRTDKVNEIFSSVLIIKFALMVASFGSMALVVFSFEKFSQHWELYFLTYGMVVGQVIFPVWLFQGMERMKYITYLSIGAKSFFTVCIFVFVQSKSDYLLVPLLNAMGFIVAGIWSLRLAKKNLNVQFSWQNAAMLRLQLIEGWHVFFASIAISLYTISTTFILGLLTNNTAVGYFVAADKVVQAVKGLYTPASQAIYPLIGRKIQEDKQTGLHFIRKTTWVVGTSMFLISVILFLLAELICNILLGVQYQQSVLLLQIMAFLPLIVALSNIFGVQTMLNLGYKQAFGKILGSAAVLGIGLSFVLVPLYEEIGTAVALLSVEIYVTVIMYLYLKVRVRGSK